MLTAPPSPIARIAAPTRPAPAAKQPFPVIATVAPVLMSVVLWMVTQSIFSLVFAALGPVIAVGNLVDSRRGGRRRAKAEAARFAAEVAHARVEIAAEHARERAAHAAVAPSAQQLLDGPLHVHWGSDDPPRLVLGLAHLRSAVTLDGAADGRADDEVSITLRDLRREASQLSAAPLVVAAGRGIGIAGAPALCVAFARGLLVQALAACSPATHEATGPESWLDSLPHAAMSGVFGVSGIVFPIAAEPAALSGVDTVVQLSGATAVVVRGDGAGTSFVPAYLSREQAQLWAAAAAQAAERTGLGAARVPAVVQFSDLPTASGALASTIGTGRLGAVEIDLVVDGPHAVVGGTTGSGKSELLSTWLLGMAAVRSPAELNLLLVDFKGGTSFGSLPDLPHCVGLVTDLEPAGAARALHSLSAELRHRERIIAAAGARSVDDVPELARLVIAVDEFAAMAAELSDLHALFADIAARGRSLGVHLVLCTQRPAGVVRDAVLANASLRISLRVNNRADSTAVIGTDAAALGSPEPGRAWLARGGGAPEQVQIARATSADIAHVAQRWGAHPAPRRPWLDPLPARLTQSGVIGLVDLPGQQAQRAVDWDPTAGSLLVLGAGASGKSGALHAVAAVHGGVTIGPDIEAVWDALADPPALLLLDDVDALISSLSPDYHQAVIDRLGVTLRSPGTTLVMTAQRLSASLQQLAGLCDHRLVLRMPTRQEHVIAGGSSESFDAALPPGAGWWRGDRAQLVLADAMPRPAQTTSVPLGDRRLGLAVSPRPQALAARLAAVGLGEVPVTDPESWLADWVAMNSLARAAPVLFHDCSPSEFRQLSRRRTLPPPIADPRSTGWLLEPECEPIRVLLEDH